MNTGGKVVLITGAANGIGAALASALAEAGHSIAAVDCDSNQLGKLHSRLNISKNVLLITADLADGEACERAVKQTLSCFDRIDAVINNVGIGVSSIRPDAERNHPTIEELSPALWDKFFAINVRAAMLVTRAAVPHMKAQRWGRIINNTTSYRTMLRVLPYGATKAALESMSAIWAKEFAGYGVTANVLVPGGPTDTALIADASGWSRDKLLKPEIMGPPARWLLSEEANTVTGQRITACKWDTSISGSEALRKASRAIGWPELADQPKAWQQQ